MPDARAMAARRGSHDRLVRLLRGGLPLIIGAMAAVLIFSPFAQRAEVSFLLSKDRVEVAQERLRAATALYRGQDSLGRPFTLSAASAVQRTSAVPVVEMTDLAGTITLAEGPATITSPVGEYDMKRESVFVRGPVQVDAANGYKLETSAVTVDLKARRLNGDGGITGRTDLGAFSANRIAVDLDARVLRLDGNARLRINQGVLR